MAETDLSVEAFTAYMRDVRSEGTAEKYETLAKHFLRVLNEWELTDLEKLPQATLMRYASSLTRRGQAPQSVHLAVAAAKRYLGWAEKQGITIPAQYQPELPRIKHKIGEVVPMEMLNRYMELAAEHLPEPYRTCIQLMPCLGLRGDEMSKLELASITRAEVKMQHDRPRETIVFTVHGKGGKQRIVPMLEMGKPILAAYLSSWRKKVPGPWLFPRVPRGRLPIAPRTLRDYLAKLREPLGMHMTPHTLRRTYAKNLYRSGVAAEVVAKVLGHASIVTTMKHYLALDEEDILIAVHKSERRY